MDMRLLLVRGDMGEAESLPASPRAGLSPRRISRQEPEEEDEEEGDIVREGQVRRRGRMDGGGRDKGEEVNKSRKG